MEILLDCNWFPLFEFLGCNLGKTGTDTHPGSPIQAVVQNWDLTDGLPFRLLDIDIKQKTRDKDKNDDYTLKRTMMKVEMSIDGTHSSARIKTP